MLNLTWSCSSMAWCTTQRTNSLTLASAQQIWMCYSFSVLYLCLLPHKVPINHAKDGSFIIWPSREALWRKFELSLRHFLCSYCVPCMINNPSWVSSSGSVESSRTEYYGMKNGVRISGSVQTVTLQMGT